MRTLLLIMCFALPTAIAYTQPYQYRLKIAESHSLVSKSQLAITAGILGKRLSGEGYDSSSVLCDSLRGQFIINVKTALDSNFIKLWLTKPFKVFFHELYSREEVLQSVSSLVKAKKEDELRKELISLLNANTENGIPNKSAFLGLLNLKDTARFILVRNALKRYLPADLVFKFSQRLAYPTNNYVEVFGLRDNSSKLYVNQVLETSKSGVDYKGFPTVLLQFNAEGKTLFAKMTRNNIGKPIAMVIDERVYCAPFVNGEIEAGMAEIAGSYTAEEAKRMVDMLNIQCLPLKLVFLQ